MITTDKIGKNSIKPLYQEDGDYVIRELTTSKEDVAFIFTLLNCPTWLQFIGDRSIHTIEDAAQFIKEGPMRSIHENGFGLYLFLYQGIPIGLSGFLKRPSLEFPDLGFAILPEFEGKGHAYEANKRVLEIGHNALKLSTIFAFTTEENKKSITLLNRLGFNFLHTKRFVGEKEIYQIFESKRHKKRHSLKENAF